MRVVDEQPLASAKATENPKQRLILVRSFSFVSIIVSVFLLFFCLSLLRTSRSQFTAVPNELVFTYLDICWCSLLDMGCIPPPPLVEQPLANAKTAASPKQRLILVRRLFLIFITVSFFC